jgi:hypothetical protein
MGNLLLTGVDGFLQMHAPDAATAVLAHPFLGEHVTPQFIGGAAVVISGVVLAQLRPPRTVAEVAPERA